MLSFPQHLREKMYGMWIRKAVFWRFWRPMGVTVLEEVSMGDNWKFSSEP